jgi:hypothetical protein
MNSKERFEAQHHIKRVAMVTKVAEVVRVNVAEHVYVMTRGRRLVWQC